MASSKNTNYLLGRAIHSIACRKQLLSGQMSKLFIGSLSRKMLAFGRDTMGHRLHVPAQLMSKAPRRHEQRMAIMGGVHHLWQMRPICVISAYAFCKPSSEADEVHLKARELCGCQWC